MASNTSGSGSNRGFASMDEEKQRNIASQGGKAAHESGNAHELSSQEAGRKGGEAASQGREQESESSDEGSRKIGSSHGNESSKSGQGGSHEQHVKAGEQSHKNT